MKIPHVELWDVLVLVLWASVQYLQETKYVWPFVVAISSICMRDRDLSISECVAALYMLRHSCGAMHTPSQWLSVPVVALAVWARFDSYLSMDNLQRRFTTLLACFLCLALLHSTADDCWVAILRLVSYTALTRIALGTYMDAWDAVAQCAWILCCPPWVLLLLLLQGNDVMSSYLYSRRRATSAVWTELV